MKNIFLLLILFFPVFLFGQSESSENVKLFYLGGQSNMDGYGFVSDLPDSLNKTFENVYIFHGNPAPDDTEGGGEGTWENLKPGHGVGFSSGGHKNNYSNRFGVELSLAAYLQAKFPGEKIALVKYSRGGTSIDSLAADNFGCWDPDYIGEKGINQYDHYLETIRQAYSNTDIDGDGTPEMLIPTGIIWMQGESDAAFTEEIATRYYDNLKRLMDLLRASLLVDDLPVVIGKISDSWDKPLGKVWKYGELVQYAQEKYARTDANTAIVRNTRYYKYSDPWHYNSEGYIDLGKRFGEAIFVLIK